jgi:hypothetical protein
MIDTEKYQPARQNMKFVTRSFHSLANKLHILAQQADIFGINQFTFRQHIHIYRQEFGKEKFLKFLQQLSISM